MCFFHLSLYLCLCGLQLVVNQLDLPQHGRLGLLQGRELPFGLVPLLLQTLQLLTGGLVLLVTDGARHSQNNSVLLWLHTVFICLSPSYTVFISTTHHPWFLLVKQLDHIQMPLLFVVTVHIMFVPLIPLLGLLQEAGLLLNNVLKRNKPQTELKKLQEPEVSNAVN